MRNVTPDDIVKLVEQEVAACPTLTAGEMALGLGVRMAIFDGALFFRNMTPGEFFSEFPTKGAKD